MTEPHPLRSQIAAFVAEAMEAARRPGTDRESVAWKTAGRICVAAWGQPVPPEPAAWVVEFPGCESYPHPYTTADPVVAEAHAKGGNVVRPLYAAAFGTLAFAGDDPHRPSQQTADAVAAAARFRGQPVCACGHVPFMHGHRGDDKFNGVCTVAGCDCHTYRASISAEEVGT